MSVRTRATRLLVLALALVVVATGCLCPFGGQLGRTPTPRRRISPIVVPREKGTLSLAGSDPATLDPALATDETSATYIVELFSGLVTLDRKLEIVPDIAERWEVSADGRVYTFHLRDDVYFHSGKKATAQDFKYSLERAADPKTRSPVAETYLGDIVGVKEKLSGKAQEVEGVKVLDERTLQLTLEAPKAYFLAKLTYPVAFVLDGESIKRGGKDWTKEPVGTGPFELERYAFGQELVLARNDRYYAGAPALEKVHFLLSGGSLMTMYENGELDAVPVSISHIEQASDPRNPLSKELVVTPLFSTSYLAFNLKEPPFDDPKVRQALATAIDTQLIAERVFLGMVEPGTWGVVPPGMPGYEPPVASLPYDPERAEELIAQSRYGSVENLPEITLYLSGEGGEVPTPISALVEMLKVNLGLEVAIQLVEENDFLAELNQRPNPYQMYVAGWIADYPDPQNFLEIQFHSRSPDNHTGYSNPQVDALLDRASVEMDRGERMKLYREAEEMIVQEAPWAPLWYGADHYLVKPYVKGLTFPPVVIPKLRYVSLEGK